MLELSKDAVHASIPARDWLINSRVRFDCAMVLVHRHQVRELLESGSPVMTNLFCDGSPSSGFEQFVCVENTTWRSGSYCRLLPVHFLNYGFAGLTGKVYAILWMIFLSVGPSVERMRWRLSTISGITSDGGTEARIADVADCLGAFYQFIGAPLRCEKLEFLFPTCVFSPGWHHRMDNILREDRHMVNLTPSLSY